jgi:hypothetical protein
VIGGGEPSRVGAAGAIRSCPLLIGPASSRHYLKAANQTALTLAQQELAAEAHGFDPDDGIHDHHRSAERTSEQAFDRLNPEFGVPADRSDRLGHLDVAQREAALALGIRVAVHDSRQNDRDPVIWQPGQDYRMADALQAARNRHGPERVGPER